MFYMCLFVWRNGLICRFLIVNGPQCQNSVRWPLLSPTNEKLYCVDMSIQFLHHMTMDDPPVKGVFIWRPTLSSLRQRVSFGNIDDLFVGTGSFNPDPNPTFAALLILFVFLKLPPSVLPSNSTDRCSSHKHIFTMLFLTIKYATHGLAFSFPTRYINMRLWT